MSGVHISKVSEQAISKHGLGLAVVVVVNFGDKHGVGGSLILINKVKCLTLANKILLKSAVEFVNVTGFSVSVRY